MGVIHRSYSCRQTYMTIVNGTLYMFFSPFQLSTAQSARWSGSLGGMVFVNVTIGMLSGAVYAIPAKVWSFRPEQRPVLPAMVAAPLIRTGVCASLEVSLVSRSRRLLMSSSHCLSCSGLSELTIRAFTRSIYSTAWWAGKFTGSS
jgi:hypothetical protein